MEVRSNWNYDRDAASLAGGLGDFPETKAQQQFKEQADINRIVKQFGVTGQVPVTTRQPITDADFVAVTDYHSAMNLIRQSEESFLALAPEVREKFENDPGRFVEFASNPENLDAMREMGLAMPKPVVPEPVQQAETGGVSQAQ